MKSSAQPGTLARDKILPGATLGIFGGGQLGRMLAMVARRWGYRVHVYTAQADCPAAGIAHRLFVGRDDDEPAFREFAESISVLTFEFENVSATALGWVPKHVPIRPGPDIFWTTQDRIREKSFLQKHQIPLAPFAVVHGLRDLEKGLQLTGWPSVLKTSSGGYDGKGQWLLRDPIDIENVWSELAERAATLEAFVNLECEVSVIVARDLRGNTATYGPIENVHRHHILDVSFTPSRVTEKVANQARGLACQIAELFDLVGLICIEYFVTRTGEVLVNEIAPRTHNSGHLTIEAFATSQFEQQLRCVCGFSLGSTELYRPAAMANLLGDCWVPQTPDWGALSEFPATHLHLYEKFPAVPGRKMGHLTSCAATVEGAIEQATRARDAITQSIHRE